MGGGCVKTTVLCLLVDSVTKICGRPTATQPGTGEPSQGAIPWVGVTLRSVTKPLVEHAKVWAHSLSGLKVRAGPCDRKHAGEIRAHSSKLVTGVLV